MEPDHHTYHTFSRSSPVGLTPPFSSLQQWSTPTNVPVPLFPLTPNTYGYVAVPSTVGSTQSLIPFDPQTLTPDSTRDGPAQISGTIPEIYSNEPQMYEQGRGGTLCQPGAEYQTELLKASDPPNPLSGWSGSQSPYHSPTSPSRFQVPPESPSAPPTPALLSPSSASTMYGTPLALASPFLNVPSYPNVQHWAHLLRTQAALSVPQSLPRAPSYAEIVSRGTSSAPSAATYSPQFISTVRPSISARPLNRPAQLQHTHLRDHRRAPSRLCNIVPIPSVLASTVDPIPNAIPGLAFLPHSFILASPDVHRDAGKVAYTGLEQINPSMMTQRPRYSDAVKGKTKGPIERVKVLHHVPSRSAPPPSSRPHNASSASVDRRPRPHSHTGLPYPPSPVPNNPPLHSLPSTAAGRSVPGGPPKTKFKGKRQGIDPCLKAAFDDGDPLRTLVDRVLASDWCQKDEEGPIYGSQQDQVTMNLALPTLQSHKSVLFAFVQACTGEDEFQCLICPRRLRLQRVLRHIRAHFDIRPFVCRTCPDCCQSKCAFPLLFTSPLLTYSQKPAPCN